MFAVISEVTMIHPTKARTAGRAAQPVYETRAMGERVFTYDPNFHPHGNKSRRYGVGYEGPDGHMCIVPDVWDEDDAWQARRVVLPDFYPEVVNA